MPATVDFEKINSGKQDFDDIYNRPDPRAYYLELGGLDYEIPSRAKPVFDAVVSAMCEVRGLKVPTVLDLGCSYGVNAALLRYGLEFDELVARYRAPGVRQAPVAEVICNDYDYFRRKAPKREVRVVGVDIAEQAVGYAEAVGIVDTAITEDLEAAPPSPEAARTLGGVDLVASTGCIGYVTEKTFEHMLAERDDGPAPWIASFVLRVFPYQPIAASLQKAGLATERLEGIAFPQRRFASEDERRNAFRSLINLGRDAKRLEADGHYYAEFFLSRPEAEARDYPLAEIIADGLSPSELAACGKVLAA